MSAVNGFAVTMEQRGPQELVTCYEVATGRLRWQHAVDTRHATVLGFIGPRSTPTIYKGRVYVQGATGIVRCLEGSSGELVWQRDLLAEVGLDSETDKQGIAWGRAGSPLAVDDKLIVPLGGPSDGPWVSLIAMNLETGDTIWEGGDEQASYSSPTLATLLGRRQILIVNQDSVSAHDVDNGETIWLHDWPGKSNADANVSQPVPIGENRVLLSKGYGVGAELIQLESGPEMWDAESVWKESRVLKTKMTNVAIADGYAYALDEGILSCVEIETGDRKWKDGRYGHGQTLLVGGEHILVTTEDGELALVDATPDEFHELSRITVLTDQTWNTACLTGEYLLIRNSEEVACVRLTLR